MDNTYAVVNFNVTHPSFENNPKVKQIVSLWLHKNQHRQCEGKFISYNLYHPTLKLDIWQLPTFQRNCQEKTVTTFSNPGDHNGRRQQDINHKKIPLKNAINSGLITVVWHQFFPKAKLEWSCSRKISAWPKATLFSYYITVLLSLYHRISPDACELAHLYGKKARRTYIVE